MTEARAATERVFRCSRWGALVRFRFAAALHPWSMTLGPTSVSTLRVRSVFFPWVREEEHLAYDSISSVLHVSGLIWDGVLIETRGGVNTLSLPWIPKGPAAELAGALRERSD